MGTQHYSLWNSEDGDDFLCFLLGGGGATLTSRDQQMFYHQPRICKQWLESVKEERTLPLNLLMN